MSEAWRGGPEQLSARLLRPMLDIFREEYGEDALLEVVDEVGATMELLQDGDRWFSAEAFRSLNRAMVRRAKDPELPYRAGRRIEEPGTLGPLRFGLLDLVTTAQLYAAMPRITRRVSRISTWEYEATSKLSARVTYRAADSAQDDVTFCRNRHGSLESIPKLIGRPAATVRHPECLHQGGEACVYEAEWLPTFPAAGLASVAAGGFAVASIYGFVQGSTWAPTLLGACIGLAFYAWSRASELNRKSTADAWEQEWLAERAERRVQELGATQRVSDAIRGSLDPQTLVQQVLNELRAALGYERAVFLAVDDEIDQLVPAGSVGFGEGEAGLDTMRIALQPEGVDRRLFGHIVAEGRPVLITDVETFARELMPENRERLLRVGTRGFVAAPTVWRGTPYGLLLVDRRGADRDLDARDLDVIGAVAGSLGAGLASARLFEKTRDALAINRKFTAYLPKPVVERLQGDPGAALELGGESIQAAIVFCDIAGFTTMSSGARPEEVIKALNAWFAITDPIIAEHEGIIDKRIGDAILMVFIHHDFEDHPVARAVACSEQMQAELLARGDEIAAAAPAFAGMQVRHAIHYGEVIAGNLGSRDRMEYTIIGDAVNVCARLEGVTPPGRVWLTGEALEAMGGTMAERYREMETLTLRGRSTETSTYEVQTIEE